jgi:uncharacterized membrane protein YdjX (TVP38/TMEM64 family)
MAIGWYLRVTSGIEWDVETARELIEEMGVWAPGVFILLILVVFFLPLLHPRFRSWVADRLRASSDAPT